MEKNILNCSLNDNLTFTTGTNLTAGTITGTASGITYSCWDYWQDSYYPYITQSYPVYIQERARDKGKQAFEIIKILKDKKLVKLEKVGDFIDLMDELIKIL